MTTPSREPSSETPARDRRAYAAAALLCLGWLVGVGVQRAQQGMQLELILLGWLVSPGVVAGLRGRWSSWVALELVALFAVAGQAVAGWGLVVAFGACLGRGARRDGGARWWARTVAALGLVPLREPLSVGPLPIEVVVLGAVAAEVAWEWAPRGAAARRIAFRVAVPGALLATIWIGGELGARLIPNRYRDTVVQGIDQNHVPGATSHWPGPVLGPRHEPNPVRWNRYGFHDRDHALTAAPGARRVLVLGDSFVEGVQVPEAALFHAQLERRLVELAPDQAWEGIAYGWSGWGQREALAALRDGGEAGDGSSYPPGLAFEPEVVLFAFMPFNDIRNNSQALEEACQREAVRGTPAREQYVRCLQSGFFFSAWLWDGVDGLWRALREQRTALDLEVFRDPPARYPELWEQAWGETRDLLAEAQRLVESRGARMGVINFAAGMEVTAHARAVSGPYDYTLPARRLSAICRELGIAFLDLGPGFGAQPKEVRDRLLIGNGDGHWSPVGHALASEIAAPWVLEIAPPR